MKKFMFVCNRCGREIEVSGEGAEADKPLDIGGVEVAVFFLRCKVHGASLSQHESRACSANAGIVPTSPIHICRQCVDVLVEGVMKQWRFWSLDWQHPIDGAILENGFHAMPETE